MSWWLLFRIIVATVALIAAWLLGVLPVLPPVLRPYSPYAALVVVYVLFVVGEYSHGIAGRKETAAYRNHVHDLQAFANRTRSTISRRALAVAFPIDKTSPIAEGFRQHFPHVVSMIDQWNAMLDGYQAKATAFMQVANAENERLKLAGAYGWPSVLQGIANRQFERIELTWSVENDFIVAERNGTWMISKVPPSEDATEKLLLALWDSANEIVGNAVVVEWIDTNRHVDELWRPLMNELAPIEYKHDPSGRCELCPR